MYPPPEIPSVDVSHNYCQNQDTDTGTSCRAGRDFTSYTQTRVCVFVCVCGSTEICHMRSFMEPQEHMKTVFKSTLRL